MIKVPARSKSAQIMITACGKRQPKELPGTQKQPKLDASVQSLCCLGWHTPNPVRREIAHVDETAVHTGHDASKARWRDLSSPDGDCSEDHTHREACDNSRNKILG